MHTKIGIDKSGIHFLTSHSQIWKSVINFHHGKNHWIQKLETNCIGNRCQLCLECLQKSLNNLPLFISTKSRRRKKVLKVDWWKLKRKNSTGPFVNINYSQVRDLHRRPNMPEKIGHQPGFGRFWTFLREILALCEMTKHFLQNSQERGGH